MQDEAGDEPGQKKAKLEETVTKSVKKAMTFVSLAEALKVDRTIYQGARGIYLLASWSSLE